MSEEKTTSQSFLSEVTTWVWLIALGLLAIVVVIFILTPALDFLPNWLYWSLLAVIVLVAVLKINRWIQLNEDFQPSQTNDDLALMKTTRSEVEGKLTVIEGSIPSEMNGVFYVVYPVGSVNSEGLPMPLSSEAGLLDYNEEYNTPLMNGDGMTLSVTFDGSNEPILETSLVKPPCYFADFNTRQQAQDQEEDETEKGSLWLNKFYNLGISRMGTLGARNLLNTAVTPVKFGDDPSFLLATYDVGRPFIMDPKSKRLTSPLGEMTDWKSNMPSGLDNIFG